MVKELERSIDCALRYEKKKDKKTFYKNLKIIIFLYLKKIQKKNILHNHLL